MNAIRTAITVAAMSLLTACAADAELTSSTMTPTTQSAATSPSTTVTEAVRNDFLLPLAEHPLESRDCYNIDANNMAVQTDCASLHVGQIVLTNTTLSDLDLSEPDPELWLWFTTAACSGPFQTFTGTTPGPELDRAPAAVLESADQSPPIVSCSIVDSTGAKWAGSAEAITGSYLGIDIGECFDFPTPTSNAIERQCDEPHEAEMYVVDTPAGVDQPDAAYPTEDEWGDIASGICDAPFATYTGVPVEDSSVLSYSYMYVLEEDWGDVAARLVSCAIANSDGTALVASTRA